MTQLVNGNLVKVTNTTSVYLVVFSQTCHVPSPQTAKNLFGSNWGNYVQTVSQATFNTVSQGPSFTAGACLVQGQGQAQIYLYSWGFKMWITSEATMNAYYFNNGNLISGLNGQLIEAMPQGHNITG